MYSYQRAIVKEHGRQSRWTEADLSQTIVADIYQLYARAFLILAHPALDHDVALDMDLVRTDFQARVVQESVEQWLITLENHSLPTVDELPTINTRYATYRDGWAAGYTIDPVSRTAHYTSELSQSETPDLRLTKDGVDYTQFHRECLVSVNGLYHFCDGGQESAHILDGARSGFHANTNHVGIYHLGLLGDLQCVPITEEMILTPAEGVQLGQSCYLYLNEDLEGRTVALVLGGYLHMIEGGFKRTGPQTFMVDFANLPWVERFYQSRKLMDLSDVEALMESNPDNPDQFLLSDLYSDAVLRKMLTLSQSFFVIIDGEDIFVEKQELEMTQLPGRYQCYQYPVYPLVTSYGVMPEYWTTGEEGIYVIAVEHNLEPCFNFDTYPYKAGLAVDPHELYYRPTRYSRAHLLKVGKDL